MATHVVHLPQAQRFEAAFGGETAICEYRRQGPLLTLFHTEVPPRLQGQGIASELVAAALAWARAEGLRVRPSCSYVAAYMQRHPETQDLLE